MAIVALTTSADQTTWADTVPGAVATGYQAQNTNIQAGYLGVDTLEIEEELILETTSDWDIKVKIKPGLIDVNGRIINVTADEIIDEFIDFSKMNPATGTYSDLFLVVKNNAGVYSIEYHYPIDSGMPVYDVDKKGFYNSVGERILSYRASPIFVDGYGVGLNILKTDPTAEGYIQSGGTITNTPTATLRTSLTAYEYKIPAGIKWKDDTVDVNITPKSCAEGAGVAVVVTSTNGAIYTSSNDDLLNWTVRSSNTSNNKNYITFANNRFVSICENGDIITSPDGITWTVRTSGTTEHLNKVAYANGLWVAVGDNGIIITSSNAITWTVRTSETTEHLKDVIYANSLWVAVGVSGVVSKSSDGVTWAGTEPFLFDANSIFYGDGLFIVCGANGLIATSSDCIDWTGQTSGTTEHLNKVSFANGLWVAVGDNGTIITSPDGSSWTVRTSGTIYNIHAVIHTGIIWVIGGGIMATSVDGEVWKTRSTSSAVLTDLIYYDETVLGTGNISGSDVTFSRSKDLWDDRNEA